MLCSFWELRLALERASGLTGWASSALDGDATDGFMALYLDKQHIVQCYRDAGSRPYMVLIGQPGEMRHTKVVVDDDWFKAAVQLFKARDEWRAYVKEAA